MFADTVTTEDAMAVFSSDNPPGYVRSVDYGRILMVKMESSAVDTAANLKGAFELQATLRRQVAGYPDRLLPVDDAAAEACGGGGDRRAGAALRRRDPRPALRAQPGTRPAVPQRYLSGFLYIRVPDAFHTRSRSPLAASRGRF